MKKAILILAVLLSLFSYCQNLTTIQTMVKSDETQLKTLSDQIINTSAEKYVFYKVADSNLRDEKRKVVVYTLGADTDNDNTKLSEQEKETMIKVVWLQKNDGFTFKEVFGPEKMIVPFWKTTFATDYEYRVSKELLYKLVKNENTFSIEKWY